MVNFIDINPKTHYTDRKEKVIFFPESQQKGEIDSMDTRYEALFTPCKIGNVDQMALYELETVANRFGGKYAKKILSTAQEPSAAHVRRAKEMGIEVRVER